MLAGSLETFTIGEILSLLAASRASGALHVWTEDDEGAVFCRDGDVAFAAVGKDDDVGDVLVRAGFVVPDTWAEVTQSDRPVDHLHEVLSHRGVDADRLHGFLATQTEETAFELDGWRHGEFRFDHRADHFLGEVFLYPTAHLLTAVRDRHHRWPTVIAKVGSADAIVRPVPLATDDGSEARISRTQLMVAAHADGRRSIRELARSLGTGLFQTCDIVGALLDARLVTLGGEAAPGWSAAPADAAIDLVIPIAEPNPARLAPETSPTPAGNPVLVEASPVAVGRFVEPGDGPARDLIVRLLSAVKEEL